MVLSSVPSMVLEMRHILLDLLYTIPSWRLCKGLTFSPLSSWCQIGVGTLHPLCPLKSSVFMHKKHQFCVALKLAVSASFSLLFTICLAILLQGSMIIFADTKNTLILWKWIQCFSVVSRFGKVTRCLQHDLFIIKNLDYLLLLLLLPLLAAATTQSFKQ